MNQKHRRERRTQEKHNRHAAFLVLLQKDPLLKSQATVLFLKVGCQWRTAVVKTESPTPPVQYSTSHVVAAFLLAVADFAFKKTHSKIHDVYESQ